MTQDSKTQEELVAAYDEYEGKTWICPRCGYPLEMVAEHAFQELWECPQCGYAKKVKQ